MNYLLIVILIITVFLFLYRTPVLKKKKYWEKRNKEKIDRLYQALDEVIPYIKDQKYFLIGGTLLGAVRDSSVVPWDDDIDIGIYVKDPEKVPEVFQSIKDKLAEKYTITVGVKNSSMTIDKEVDIVMFTTHEDGMIRFYSYVHRNLWPDEYFYPDEIKNLVKIKFGNKYYPVPSNTKNVIRRHYGDNCLKKKKITHIHSSTKFRFEPEYFLEQTDMFIIWLMTITDTNYIEPFMIFSKKN